ncbi:matrixin family metalloprotease [Streptomyces sp. NPDC051963]|uniref:matrixin family metalloprotease n=1 Tax=Streptomyces sp. NPDC051963 TaxID=3365678 RepID=UPI0037D66D3A
MALDNSCVLDEGVLTVSDLPDGSSAIKCSAVGRVVTHEGLSVTIPEPGVGVLGEALTDDGGTVEFGVDVAKDGTLSYNLGHEVGESGESVADGWDIPDPIIADPEGDASEAEADTGAEAVDPADDTSPLMEEVEALSSSAPCSDGAYTKKDLKEYGTYNWYIGDGGMPAGLSRTDAKWAIYDAIDNITDSYNNCGYSDQVGAKTNFLSETSREASINSSSGCGDNDGISVWDAGDLKDSHVAYTCSWHWVYPGAANDLREADVRFNTHDKDFTNVVRSNCSNKFDLRSVATHEAGHVFGLGHVGSGHENLTMYTNSFKCQTTARTLGKGDVLGLRSLY